MRLNAVDFPFDDLLCCAFFIRRREREREKWGRNFPVWFLLIISLHNASEKNSRGILFSRWASTIKCESANTSGKSTVKVFSELYSGKLSLSAKSSMWSFIVLIFVLLPSFPHFFHSIFLHLIQLSLFMLLLTLNFSLPLLSSS